MLSLLPGSNPSSLATHTQTHTHTHTHTCVHILLSEFSFQYTNLNVMSLLLKHIYSSLHCQYVKSRFLNKASKILEDVAQIHSTSSSPHSGLHVAAASVLPLLLFFLSSMVLHSESTHFHLCFRTQVRCYLGAKLLNFTNSNQSSHL